MVEACHDVIKWAWPIWPGEIAATLVICQGGGGLADYFFWPLLGGKGRVNRERD